MSVNLDADMNHRQTFVERFPDDLDAKALRPQLAALRERLAER